MHPINKLLSHFFGIELMRTARTSLDVASMYKFISRYAALYRKLKKQPGDFDIFGQFTADDEEDHPISYIDYECAFASDNISKLNPTKVLDIGSYRHFIIGLLGHFQVTTVDVRTRTPISSNETVATCDAKKLHLSDESFDAVISLCALEHFGLGRYGDDFDIEADKKAVAEMKRVLTPGGHLIFSTHITRTKPAIAFNAHRIYNYDMIRTFTSDMSLVEEKFFSHAKGNFCPYEAVTNEPKIWDIYLGCWKK